MQKTRGTLYLLTNNKKERCGMAQTIGLSEPGFVVVYHKVGSKHAPQCGVCKRMAGINGLVLKDNHVTNISLTIGSAEICEDLGCAAATMSRFEKLAEEKRQAK